MSDKIQGLKVWLLVNGKWFEVELKNEVKKTIFKIIDKEVIVLKPLNT